MLVCRLEETGVSEGRRGCLDQPLSLRQAAGVGLESRRIRADRVRELAQVRIGPIHQVLPRRGGGVEARAINGNVTVSIDAVGEELVDVRSTNGEVDLALPEDAAITLLATTNNGEVDVSALTLESIGEQTERRVRGRMNGGGTTVEVSTINGDLRVVTHP